MSKADELRLPEYLGHIVDAVGRINHYTEGMSEEGFLGDARTQDAVIRNFEIIGEACNNVVKNYPSFADQHPEVQWGFAYEMRNALVHGYFKVDLGIVWRTIQNDLPAFLSHVRTLLA